MQFRPKSFWTPRYIRDRLALDYHQRRFPDLPWWPAEATRQLGELLKSSDVCLEWGSGRSTAWLSQRTCAVHSIEHDREWFDRVQDQLAERGSPAGAVRLLDDAPHDRPEASPYVRVVDEFADGELNVCVVDGAHRGKCALAAVPKLAPYGLLMVDDAHWFLDHATTAPHSRTGKGPKDEDWRQFGDLVADWRCVWTTDGVTDTAIWVKPC
ncbi:MAG: O-methyltransferase [Solirubrobacteraceae bacterium]